MSLPQRLKAKRAAQLAWKMRQIRAALEFKKKWETNPEGMEKRRRAGVKSNAARWAKSREAWIRHFDSLEDELTPAEARQVAEGFLKMKAGKWRTKKHPRCARSVLKRVSKLGVWKFDEMRGLYINPWREEMRRREAAEREERRRFDEAESRAAAERSRAAAEAKRAAEEARRAEETEAARRAAEAAKPAPAGWDDFIPAEDKPALLEWLIRRGRLTRGQTLADARAKDAEWISRADAELISQWAEVGRAWLRPAPAGWDDFIPEEDKPAVLAYAREIATACNAWSLADLPERLAEGIRKEWETLPPMPLNRYEMLAAGRAHLRQLRQVAEAVLCAD